MLPTGNNVIDFQNKSRKSALSEKKQQEIIQECIKNIGRWYDFFSHNITAFRRDKDFYEGRQWDDFEFSTYVSNGKVPFTFNKLKPLVRQLIGEQINMQPALNLIPTDNNGVNPKNTLMLQNFLRHLAYGSHAARSYTDAFVNQCSGGWGVLKVKTDYENPYKFEQKILIETCKEPLNIGFDPNAKEIGKTDGEYCFAFETLKKEDFEATYPGKKASPGASVFGGQRDYLPQIDSKTIVIVDYYKKEYKTKTLVEYTNGINFKQTVLKEDAEQLKEQYLELMTQQGLDFFEIPPLYESNRRDTKLTFIRCYKLTSEQVLEHYEWHSTKLPFVFVDGLSTFIDGKQITESFIHPARDAQKTYNYCISEAINGLSHTRREQVWLTRTQADGHEDVLRYPDRQQGYVEYNFDPEAPAPIFRPPEELAKSFFDLMERAEEDIYKTLGIYAANRGEVPNQTSGIAVGRTIMQGNLSFIQLLQNLYNAMQTVGEIILELIPKIYDTERIVSILDETGAQKNITINQVNGMQVQNDVTQSIYALEIQPVASFVIQQQMVQEQLYKLASLSPEIVPLVTDLISGTIESPIAPRLVERLKTLVPPNLLRQEQGLPPLAASPSPQDQLAQLQMQKMMAEIQKIGAQIQEIQTNARTKHATIQGSVRKMQNDYLLSLEKNALERDRMAAEIYKTQIDAEAEIAKANLQKESSVISAMGALQKAREDAEKRMN